MSEVNRTAARRWTLDAGRWTEEIWNKGDLSVIPQMISTAFAFHRTAGPDYGGHAGLKDAASYVRREGESCRAGGTGCSPAPSVVFWDSPGTWGRRLRREREEYRP